MGLANALLRQRNTILEEGQEEEDTPDIVLPTKQANDAINTATSAAEFANTALGAIPKGLGLLRTGVGRMFGEAPADLVAATAPPAAPPAEGVSLQDLVLGGIIIPTGILGGLHMARGGYQAWRRRDLKQRLKDDHEAYLQALKAEAEQSKKATSNEPRQPLSMTSLLAMGVLGLPFLSAVTSGMLTDRILTQQFPLRKQKTDRTRIKFEDEEPDVKMARDLSQDLLVHTAMTFNKQAADAGVLDMVGAVAAGRLRDIEDVMCKRGYEAAFELAEGCARFVPSHPLLKCAAVRLLMQSAAAAPVALMSAAVFKNTAPHWAAQGAEIAAYPKLASALETYGGLAVAASMAANTDGGLDAVRDVEVPAGLKLAAVFEAAGTAAHGVSTLQGGATHARHSDESSIPTKPAQVADEVDAVLASAKNKGA